MEELLKRCNKEITRADWKQHTKDTALRQDLHDYMTTRNCNLIQMVDTGEFMFQQINKTLTIT